MAWVERYDITDSGQKDGAKNEDRTVLFYVDQAAQLAFDPQHVGIVLRGDVHPRIEGLYADEFRVVKQTTDSCEVEATYTTDAAAFNASVTVQRSAHKREAQFRRVETKIPIVREVRSKLMGAPTGSTQLPSYEVDFLTIYETQPVIQVQVTLPTMTDDQIRTIDSQDGGLHLIGGPPLGTYVRPARFEAGDIVQHGPGKWKVLYTWYTDKGTRSGKLAGRGEDFGGNPGEPRGLPNPAVYGPAGSEVKQYRPPEHASMLSATGINGVGLPFQDANKYIRSPFHEVHYILHTDLPPVFTQFCPFRVESNPATGPVNGLGWQLLPGSPQP